MEETPSVGLVGWLTDRLAGWLSGWLDGCLACARWLIARQTLPRRLAGWLTLPRRLAGWHYQGGWLTNTTMEAGWLAYYLTNWLVGCMNALSAGWPIGRFSGWLAHWLTRDQPAAGRQACRLAGHRHINYRCDSLIALTRVRLTGNSVMIYRRAALSSHCLNAWIRSTIVVISQLLPPGTGRSVFMAR